MRLSTTVWDRAPKFCTYCGEELDVRLEDHFTSSMVSVYATCPMREKDSLKNLWGMLPKKTKYHTDFFVGIEDPVYGFDPQTGEKLDE